jgi:hypothetical protein
MMSRKLPPANLIASLLGIALVASAEFLPWVGQLNAFELGRLAGYSTAFAIYYFPLIGACLFVIGLVLRLRTEAPTAALFLDLVGLVLLMLFLGDVAGEYSVWNSPGLYALITGMTLVLIEMLWFHTTVARITIE